MVDPYASAAEPVLLSSTENGVCTLTLNRPDRLNAVSLALYEALAREVRRIEGDQTVRAVVLTGAGRAFCAGADLKAHAERAPEGQDRNAYARAAQRANLALQRVSKPVIAAVNGAAVGAGLELALSCDLMLVAADAKLRLPEIALGTFVGGGVMRILPQRVGLARAKEIIFIGDFFSGEQASEWGLANRAVPRDAVAAEARALALLLAASAPVSLAKAKTIFRKAANAPMRRVMQWEEEALVQCMATNDWREGIAAFREGRPPVYTGT